MTFSIDKQINIEKMLSDERVSEAVNDILLELARAERIHPIWPSDIIHQTSIMAEEAGEAVKAALDSVYKGRSVSLVRGELIQTGAMCLRALINLEDKP